jgi:predicted nucleic acid-binding protein
VRICVDTAILIDILKDEFRSYQERLYDALRQGEDPVAPVVVYAELIPQFQGDARPLHQFLSEHKVDVQPLDVDAVTAAANA